MVRTNPQIARTRAAVVTAAGEILAERGFTAATVDAVAERSGVARSTIYRHWADLGSLLIEAFGELAGTDLPTPDTGGVRDDLVAVFSALADGVRRAPSLRALPSLADAAQRDERLDALLASFIDARREPARVVLRRAVERGDLPPDVPAEWLLDLIGGPLFYRQLVSRQALDEPGLVEFLVDTALAGLTR